MRFLSNIPIQKKVTRIILLTCSVTLLMAGTVVLGIQFKEPCVKILSEIFL